MHGAGGGGSSAPPPPLPPPIRRRCRGARAGPGAAVVGQSRAGPGRGERGVPRCCNFFFFSAEEGGRWIELCHVADKFPLASSPCTSPPPPLRTHAFFFLWFFFFFLTPFPPTTTPPLPVSPLGCNIFSCSASSPSYAGGGERFS